MRYALLVTTFALSTLAAPVPEASPIFKTGGSGCAKVVGGVCVAAGKREAGQPIKANIEARFPEPNVRKKKGSRLSESSKRSEEDNIEARAGRNQGSKRSEENGVEARAGRNQGSKRESQDDHEEETTEATGLMIDADKRSAQPFSRGSHPRRSIESEQESEEDEEDEDTEDINELGARYIRGKPARRSAEPFSRGSHPRRSAEPFSRGSHPPRSAEAEPGFTRSGSGRRSAEAEPGFTRSGSGRRSAEAEPFSRGSHPP